MTETCAEALPRKGMRKRARWIPCGPVRELHSCEAVDCPWCGEDQPDDTLGDIIEGTIMACTSCHRAFDLLRDDEASPAVVGLMTAADIRYIGQQLARSY